MTKKECVKLIIDFQSEKLDGDICNLGNFCFADILSDKKFGGEGDCDSTTIVKAIYFILYDIPFDDIGTDCVYGGDTLNTFNTLLSSRLGNELLTKSENERKEMTNLSIENCTHESIEIPKSLEDSIKEFSRSYLTIGNFMPLPKNRGPNINSTLNQYRAQNGYADYYDKFLRELKKCFIFQGESIQSLNECGVDFGLLELYKSNINFFKTNNGSFLDFCKKYYLDVFLDRNENPNFKSKLYRARCEGKSINSADYLKEVRYYIDSVLPNIRKRSKKIVKELIRIIPEL